MRKVIEELLYKEMSRKEFISTLGIGFLSIIGFSGLIKLLTTRGNRTTKTGYGHSRYGR